MLLTYKNEKGEENSINTKFIKTARVKGDELYLKLIDDECVVIKRKFNVYFDVLVGKVIRGYSCYGV